jgi:hypothetical protein
VKQASREVWNDALGKIETVGGSERQRTIFCTVGEKKRLFLRRHRNAGRPFL